MLFRSILGSARGGVSRDKHGITVAEEAVTLLNGCRISGHGFGIAGECRHQHQQGRLGQVEIGNQRVHHVEGLAWVDEDVGVAAERLELTIARRTFQRAYAGGTDRDYPTTTRAAGDDRIHPCLADFQPLAVHVMRFDTLHTHGLEGAGTDVQGNKSSLDAFLAKCGEQIIVEMQPGSRRRHGTGALRVDGLVALAVGTTSVRSLESAARDGELKPFSGDTDIFIYPGKPFHVVDSLVTNFHLPESTLLMLVSAFAGYPETMAAYAAAVAEGYRFFSYGDAMFITRNPAARGPEDRS